MNTSPFPILIHRHALAKLYIYEIHSRISCAVSILGGHRYQVCRRAGRTALLPSPTLSWSKKTARLSPMSRCWRRPDGAEGKTEAFRKNAEGLCFLLHRKNMVCFIVFGFLISYFIK